MQGRAMLATTTTSSRPTWAHHQGAKPATCRAVLSTHAGTSSTAASARQGGGTARRGVDGAGHGAALRGDAFGGLRSARRVRTQPGVAHGGGGGPLSWVLRAVRGRGTELAPREAPPGMALATFAGGCFWGLELAFQRVPGVTATSVGYTGGKSPNPSYNEVCSGFTGHTEAVQVTYNPDEVSFSELVDVFFDKVDPTTLNRQGNDSGTQYRSGIFYHDEEQQQTAKDKFANLNKLLAEGRPPRRYEGKQVMSTIEPAGDYYLAEDYHQQYLSTGGRFAQPQSAAKGCNDPIRCYG